MVPTLTAVIRGCGPDPRIAGGAGRWCGTRLLLGGRAAAGEWAGRAADLFGGALDGLGAGDRGPARPGDRARVTLWVALAAVGIVFGAGGLVYRLKGAAKGSAGPVLPSPDVVRDPRILLLIAGVFVLALATMLHLPAPGWLLLVTAAGLILAGALAARSAPVTGPGGALVAPGGDARPRTGPAAAGPAGPTPTGPPPPAGGRAAPGRPGRPGGSAGSAPASARTLVAPTGSAAATGSAAPAEPADVPESARLRPPARPGMRDGALALVLALTAYRAYSGVIGHDWPFLRGSDQFSHAVMAEQMLTHGSYGSYLIYPPGFPALTAVICGSAG